ncbi:MAG: HK97 family phage prohead protease [Treponema sp.]|jgi:HK97 family phage prohead protease|nr:HK97 family phage prohead protease [Treponema sp.]
MKEKRNIAFKRIALRSTEKEGKKRIEGLIPYDSESVPLWGTIEVIAPGAFKNCLEAKTEVRALWNHNDSHVLGSTKSGTLELEDTPEGLLCRCELPRTSYADDLFEVISRGDVTTMSFGFYPVVWESDSGKVRRLQEIVLDEVSFGVTYPAYPETTSEAHTRSRKLMKRSIDVEGINALLDKETLTDEDKTRIKELIESLQGLIGTSEAPPGPQETASETPPGPESPETEELALLETALEMELLDLNELALQVQSIEEQEQKEKGL